jgi:hypothetical protein
VLVKGLRLPSDCKDIERVVITASTQEAASRDSLYVVHLVWAPLGPAPLERFLDSYRRHDAGAPHGLVVLFNGFAPDADLAPWRKLLSNTSYDEVRLESPMLDLAAYIAVIEQRSAARYCFLNSYSEILADGWLMKLLTAMALPDVGIVGTTGSWASTRSMKLHLLGLPSAYAGVLPARKVAAEQFMALESEISGRVAPKSFWGRMRSRLDTLYEIPERTLPYDAFPAYHIRTNAFMLTRDAIDQLKLRSVQTKQDAYMLENGRHSITREMQRKGLRALVVDRDGAVYDAPEWDRSRTFWQGHQEGLMIADNQTRTYAQADVARRRLLAAFAWGRNADPGNP